jgi:hypothetical protein
LHEVFARKWMAGFWGLTRLTLSWSRRQSAYFAEPAGLDAVQREGSSLPPSLVCFCFPAPDRWLLQRSGALTLPQGAVSDLSTRNAVERTFRSGPVRCRKSESAPHRGLCLYLFSLLDVSRGGLGLELRRFCLPLEQRKPRPSRERSRGETNFVPGVSAGVFRGDGEPSLSLLGIGAKSGRSHDLRESRRFHEVECNGA